MRKFAPLIFGVALMAGALPAMSDIVIAPEVGIGFREYVTREEPVIIDGEIVVGAELPDTVELRAVPDTIITTAPDLKAYRYVYVGDRIAIVEPETRRIITFVD